MRFGLLIGVFLIYLYFGPWAFESGIASARHSLATGDGIASIVLVPVIIVAVIAGVIIALGVHFSAPIGAGYAKIKLAKDIVTAVAPQKVKDGVTHLKDSFFDWLSDLAEDFIAPPAVSLGGATLTIVAIWCLSRYGYLMLKITSGRNIVYVILALIVIVTCNYWILKVLGFVEDFINWREERDIP